MRCFDGTLAGLDQVKNGKSKERMPDCIKYTLITTWTLWTAVGNNAFGHARVCESFR